MAQQGDDSKGDSVDDNTVNRVTSGLTYLLRPIKGLDSNRKYLSCAANGSVVDLWDKNDGSGRQQWLITKVGMEQNNGIFHLVPHDGLSSNRKFLSCTSDGSKCDLWDKDDDSGRQRWVFIPIGEDPKTEQPLFNIRVEKGVNNGRTWLSCASDGKRVDLWYSDDKSGRQRWIVEPLDMVIQGIDFDTAAGQILDKAPMEIATQTLENTTSSVQAMKFVVSSEVTNASTFAQEAGVSVTVGTEFETGVPFVADGKVSMSLTASYKASWSSSSSTKQSWTQEFPVQVNPGKTVRATATVFKANMSVPYTATLKSKATGQTAKAKGVWHGASTWDIQYKTQEI